MIEKRVRNMESLPVTLALLLAVATLGQSQIVGNPGTEPWNMIILPACQIKGMDVSAGMAKATQCISQLSGANPMAICSKKKERNDCLKPYYNDIKKCFDSAGDVDKAFNAQKEAVEFFCEDNGKKFTEMTQKDLECEQKDTSKCMQDKMKSAMPEFTGLFTDKNCKAMHAMVECTEEAFKDCKTMKMKDVMVGQINAMLDETPCGSGATTAMFAAPILLFTLLCHALTKFLF